MKAAFASRRVSQNEIYGAGEAGMGYHDFTLVFSWWRKRDYMVAAWWIFSNTLEVWTPRT